MSDNPLHIVVDAGMRGVFVAIHPEERDAEIRRAQREADREDVRKYNDDCRNRNKRPWYWRGPKPQYFGSRALLGPIEETG